ncbi:MAG: hypothetical protein IJP70_03455 [Bacteroidales bacterium]|nr:hypothetical protein [Bacteroidales bacterium]
MQQKAKDNKVIKQMKRGKKYLPIEISERDSKVLITTSQDANGVISVEKGSINVPIDNLKEYLPQILTIISAVIEEIWKFKTKKENKNDAEDSDNPYDPNHHSPETIININIIFGGGNIIKK